MSSEEFVTCDLALRGDVLPVEHSDHRQNQDFKIEQAGLMLQIPEVEFKLAFPRQTISSVNLSPASDSWACLVAVCLLWGVPLQINRWQGAGTDQAHFTTQDVPKFREFVQTGGS